MNRHRWNRLRSRATSYLCSQKGATAVEYAFLAPLFLALLFALVQFGILYHQSSRLERAMFTTQQKLANKAERPATAEDVKMMVCADASLDCDKKGFFVELSPLTESSPAPGALTKDSYKLEPGKPNILRVSYPWRNPVPSFALNMVGLGHLETLNLQSAVFFLPSE